MHDSGIVHVVSCSGGKDSTASILRSRELGIQARYVFADVGNEHQLTYEYLDYLEDRLCITIERIKPDFSEWMAKRRAWVREVGPRRGYTPAMVERIVSHLKPTGIPFLDLCLIKGFFPSTKRKFCTQFLKQVPINTLVTEPLLEADREVWSWQGVRREESAARATASHFEASRDGWEGFFIYRPIVEWTTDEVFAMHRRHAVKPNPLYSLGMTRVGCMPCVNTRKEELYQIQKQFPEVIDRIAKWERLVMLCSKKGVTTFFHARTIPNRGGGDTRSHIRNAAKWSKTDRYGQYDMLKAMEAPAECASQYGLCE
ncbi:phosphoadenosine phosphosulfate reductase family protein [Pseudodesulfovibrio nedwellii]|nr:phosphoadenosine phosphosulfate reductase family protein [Pseudodesulfovibrio nedwellii]